VLERKTFHCSADARIGKSLSDKVYYQAKGNNQLLEDENMRASDGDDRKKSLLLKIDIDALQQ
jgi:hypothetical protein